jgi:hypothetical protein
MPNIGSKPMEGSIDGERRAQNFNAKEVADLILEALLHIRELQLRAKDPEVIELAEKAEKALAPVNQRIRTAANGFPSTSSEIRDVSEHHHILR